MKMNNLSIIDRLDQIPENTPWEKLKYERVQANTLRTTNGWEYTVGVVTDLGNIEKSVWIEAIKRIIVQKHEENLYRVLLSWVSNNIAWLQKTAECEEEALIFYSQRAFENPKWSYYHCFREYCQKKS